MRRPLIVVDQLEDWAPYAEGAAVASAADYLARPTSFPKVARVINLCRQGAYQSEGYYVSLLAEARGKRALPSVRTILELAEGAREEQVRAPKGGAAEDEVPESATFFFGRASNPVLAPLAAATFNRFPMPILQVQVSRDASGLVASNVRAGKLEKLDDASQTLFGECLDHFNGRVWRSDNKRSSRYDLAILVDPAEKLPPSNKSAIKKFVSVAKSVGFDAEVITLADSPRLLEFDALLIRTTTAINHETYRMARRADREGMAVIDDPDSILRCCNKVFLHDLLQTNKVDIPPSRMVMRGTDVEHQQIAVDLGLPLVLKVPDGSFSRGVFKVSTFEEFTTRCKELLAESAVIIAQKYLPTPFDWRIGVLEGRPLYACKYYMARDHWQIINHSPKKGGSRTGDVDCLPLAHVPPRVLRAATKAARLVGDGLYGVDVKEVDGVPMVIEVNDNPTIDSGVEDVMLGEELYRQILSKLASTLQERGRIERS